MTSFFYLIVIGYILSNIMPSPNDFIINFKTITIKLMTINNLRVYLMALVVLGMLLLLPIKSYATTLSTSSTFCGSTDQSLSTLEDITNNPVATGSVYLKLNYQSNPINLSLYLNNYVASQCNLIGSVSTNSNTWTYIGKISSSTNDVIIQGVGIGAVPYQAAAQLLVVPNNQCLPTSNCNLTFDGLAGVLQLDNSNIISGATDQIAIHTLKPISGIGVRSVSYYADSQKGALYTSNSLRPFNKNYLSGGTHSIQIQIKLDNGQSVFVNQTINMGIDWTGALLVKSLIYRNSGSAAVFIVLGISILILLIIFVLARFIYMQRRTDKLHGLDNYQASDISDISDIDDDDDIFTSL
jgi:hypothetical protein